MDGTFSIQMEACNCIASTKKPGIDESVPSNYRPVSNLSFLSKILEHVVHKQMTGYLQQNNLLPEFQSAYHHHHSTKFAVLNVFSDVVDALDRSGLVLLSLLDLSAAFDTVDHDIMWQQLTMSFRIRARSLQ